MQYIFVISSKIFLVMNSQSFVNDEIHKTFFAMQAIL